MAALDNIASELLKSANEADLIYKRTRDQAQRDKAVRLRRIVENLKAISAGGLTPTLDEVLTEGNVSTNTLNVGGITSDYFQLDTTATPTLAPGMFAWNDAYGTADLRLKGNNVTLQVGQETLARVVNKTGSDLLESQYKVVRVRIASEGGAQGQRLAVVLAQGNNDPDSATTLGIVTEDIPNNQEGFITIFGNVNNINTTGSLQGETWVDGDVLYLSPTTPGAITKVKPVAPQHTLIVGYVVYAHINQGKIFVKVDNGYELDELHNVLITSPANNDLLQYNSAQQVWKNVASSVAVPTPTLAQVTTAGNTTTNAINVGDVTSTGVIKSVVSSVTAQFTAYNPTNNFPRAQFQVGQNSSDNNAGLTVAPLFSSAGVQKPAFIQVSTNKNVSDSGQFSGYFIVNTNLFTIGTNKVDGQVAGGVPIAFSPAGVEAMRIQNNGNIQIGTTTNAGYKLDVSGTVRFTHGLTIDYFGATIGGVTLALSSQAGGTISSGASAGNNNGPYITLSGPAYLNPTAGNSGMFSITGLYYASSGTAIFNHLNLAPTINNSGTYSGIVRGIYYNPTLTSLTGTTHRAIETTSGDVLLGTTSGNVGIGTSTLGTATELTLGGSQTASSAVARGQLLNTTLVAAANNDVLVGLDINPTFTNGAFTGVTNYALRLGNNQNMLLQGEGMIYHNSGSSRILAGRDAAAVYFGYNFGSQQIHIGSVGSGNILFRSSGNVCLENANSNLLVGTTTNAGYKLDVAGTVRAQVSLSGTPNIIHVSNLQTDGGPGGAIAFYTGGVVGNASRITAQRSGPVGQSDIALETNGVTRLFVSVLGNVGLGTTTPTDKLHIVDNTNGNKFARISAGGTDASAAWVAQNDQVDNIVYRVFGSAVTGSQMGQALARSASLIANLGGTGKFLIGSFSSTDLIFGTSDQARMRLVDATGNFLIGTMTDTGNKLTVSGNIDAQGYKVNNVLGYTGILNIPTNPPGQQNIDIQGGIVINIF